MKDYGPSVVYCTLCGCRVARDLHVTRTGRNADASRRHLAQAATLHPLRALALWLVWPVRRTYRSWRYWRMQARRTAARRIRDDW